MTACSPEGSLKEIKRVKTICWTDIREEKLNETTTRKMFWGENIMIVRVELAPNAVIPVHEHVSEQITMVEKGSIVMSFPDERVTFQAGDMLVIPASKPHGVTAGPHGVVAVDVFSPIRKDFIEGSASYFSDAAAGVSQESEKDPYERLHGYLMAKGIDLGVDELKQVPLDLLARYTYEKECITMGELRRILGLDKSGAKALLREWKHGDDHSESSYRRSLERIVVLISDLKPKQDK